MSAWVVENEHIASMVNAADHHARRQHGQFNWYAKEDGETVCYELSRMGEDKTEDAYTVSEGYAEGYEYPKHVTVSFDTLGAMLLAENVRSVNARYNEDNIEPIYKHSDVYTSPVVTIKSIHCYEYQSCEHEEWEASPAFAFCQQLRASIETDLPGYDDAPWGIDRSNIASVAR